MPARHRTVREEPKFAEQLAALAADHRRLDDVLAALYWALANAPESFAAVPGTELRIAKTTPYPEAPALRIFFTFTKTEVHLLHVEFA